MTSKFPLPSQSDKAVIIGHSGSGKTTLMSYIVNQLPYKPLYVIDTTNQMSYVPSYNYLGKTECKVKRKEKYCLKLHTSAQLEFFISKLNHDKKQFFLAIDEIDRFTNPHYLFPETKLWLEEGRNFNRGGLFTVRRVGFLNKSILGNSHWLYLFKTNNRIDKQYLSAILDYDISELSYSGDYSFFTFDLYKSELIGEYELDGNRIMKYE